MNQNNLNCPVCGKPKTKDAELCLKCQSDKKYFICEDFTHKKEHNGREFSIPVPWCEKDDCRVISKDGWKCDDCPDKRGYWCGR